MDSSNNKIDNLILLCNECHGKRHRTMNLGERPTKEVICPKCNYHWKYKGFSPRITCPNCLNKCSIEVIEVTPKQ